MRFFSFICMVLLLSACVGPGEIIERIRTPRPMNLGATPPGSAIFQQGWEDGCSGGLKGYGNTRYKTAYEYKQDPNLIHNPEYYRAWKDGYLYCRWYSWNWVIPLRK